MPDAERLASPVLLGRALRTMRERAGLTQEQLADRLGAHPTFVGRLERGVRGTTWRTIIRFVVAVGADLHDLADAFEQAQR